MGKNNPRKGRRHTILSILLVIVTGAFSTLLTLTVSSPLEGDAIGPLLASGLLFLLVLLFLSLWLSSFLRSPLIWPAVIYEQYGVSHFVTPFSPGEGESAGEGGRLTTTVFYSNIRGFSGYCTEHSDETVLGTLQNLRVMQSDQIRALDGHVNSHTGDKLVALFSGRDAALEACKAALRIQNALSGTASEPFDGLTVSIGIHTGEVILRSPESSIGTDTTVIGDAFNAASRLCGAAAPGQILISGQTCELIAELVHVDGPYRLKAKGKGKEEYMTVYFLKEMLAAADE